MMNELSPRQPVVYIPHGGGPWPFVDVGPAKQWSGLRHYTEHLSTVARPGLEAIVVVSAHWEASLPTVMSHPHPPLLYDYNGFPAAAYDVQWPAPGAPAWAARVRACIENAGLESAEDSARGFDHGTFVPLKLAFPDAQVPTFQLSLVRGLDPQTHIDIGRALAPLRDEGLFIIGSGMSFHNMGAFRDGTGADASSAFDAWLAHAVARPPDERNAALRSWAAAPSAREAHPREEHLLPLMVIAGAAGDDVGHVPYRDVVMGATVSAVHFGTSDAA